METLVSLFSSLEKKIPISWISLIFMIFVVIKLNGMGIKLNGMAQDIHRIEKKLDVHISNSERKFEQLNTRLFEHKTYVIIV